MGLKLRVTGFSALEFMCWGLSELRVEGLAQRFKALGCWGGVQGLVL